MRLELRYAKLLLATDGSEVTAPTAETLFFVSPPVLSL